MMKGLFDLYVHSSFLNVRSWVFVFALVIVSGCASQIFKVGDSDFGTPATSQTQIFFLEGIGQSQELDVAQICGGASSVSEVEFLETPIDVVVDYFTNGLVSPRSIRTYCDS